MAVMAGACITIDRFLGQEQAAVLLADLLQHESAFTPATVGSGTRERIDTAQRLVGHADVDSSALNAFVEAFSARVPDLCRQLGLPAFHPHELEVDILAYGDGGFYHRHVDVALGANRPETSRLLSAVYYLHRLPRRFTGGALRFYAVPGGDSTDVEPESDRLVAFPSFTPHEVLPVGVPSGAFADRRFTISVWVRRARVSG